MFVLFAVPVGVALGYLLGGRLERLSEITFQWAWLAVARARGPDPVVLDAARRGIRVAASGKRSTWRRPAAVLVAVLAQPRRARPGARRHRRDLEPRRHRRQRRRHADDRRGAGGGRPRRGDGFSNSAVLENPALAPLTDIFALPPWLPFANVFSIGDVLIGSGSSSSSPSGCARGVPRTPERCRNAPDPTRWSCALVPMAYGRGSGALVRCCLGTPSVPEMTTKRRERDEEPHQVADLPDAHAPVSARQLRPRAGSGASLVVISGSI